MYYLADDASCAALICQLFVYCIVILFNLFLRNLLVATIVMEFRLRTLPKKYLKRRKLLRPRIKQRKRIGDVAEKDMASTIDSLRCSPAPSGLQSSNGKNVNTPSPFLDNSPNETSRPQSSLFLDTSNAASGLREQNLSSVTYPNSQLRITSPGLGTPIARGRNVADADHRFETVDVEQVQVGQGSSRKPKSRIYALKKMLKTLRRKAVTFFGKLKEQAGMVHENFRAYMQRIYYRYLIFKRKVSNDFPLSLRYDILISLLAYSVVFCFTVPTTRPAFVFQNQAPFEFFFRHLSITGDLSPWSSLPSS